MNQTRGRLIEVTGLLGLVLACSCSLALQEAPQKDDGSDFDEDEDELEDELDPCQPGECPSFVNSRLIGTASALEAWLDDRRGDFTRRHLIRIESTQDLAGGTYSTSCFSGTLEPRVAGESDVILSDADLDGVCVPPLALSNDDGERVGTYLGHRGVGAIEEARLEAGSYTTTIEIGGAATSASAFWRLRPVADAVHLGMRGAGVVVEGSISILDGHTELIGIAITDWDPATTQAALEVSAPECFINQVLIHDPLPGNAVGVLVSGLEDPLDPSAYGRDLIVANSVFRQLGGPAVTELAAYNTVEVFNVTALGCVLDPASPTACFGGLDGQTIANTIALNQSDELGREDFGPDVAPFESGNNVASDLTAPGATAYFSDLPDDIFFPAGEALRPRANSVADSSGQILTDIRRDISAAIDGVVRSDTDPWHVGAYGALSAPP